ncbi:biopolymer transporter ExbD [Iocasia frigidifontis]|uniref:Biopolymer transporter ExbD n=2 Tax=Halanaerobiaceae TaxID=972 RepID=A0A8A7K954_9FIRM|nr:biopolymer transporter ExbD [Iocasia fonsfrigidae]QTL98333.1 biopolymer transporter ExbD [Iocasia fonsfrigidae]
MFKTTLKKKSSINIIPMIDVIFFLLVFFMLFTTFRTTPTGIDLQLPKAVTVSEQDSDNLIIDISENGDLYYENKKISINRIREIAATYYQNNNNTIAIINADEQVLYKDIIAVMDNLRQSGIYKLALAAEKKE